MKNNHPKVNFGKTGILLINLEHQTQQAGGTLENT